MTDDDARRVRRATADDLQAILDIEQAAFEAARRSSRASLRRALRSPFQRVLVLESAGAVAGFVIVWPHRLSWRIYNLAAHPTHRNQGVGGTLLAAAVDHAGCAGARRVILESRLDPALLRFYEQRGFRQTQRLPDYYGAGEDAARLELRLAGEAGEMLPTSC